MLSSFEHYSWINEQKDMKLRKEKIFVMKSIIKFYVIGASEKSLQMNSNEFFRKIMFWKKGKILMFFGKEKKERWQ